MAEYDEFLPDQGTIDLRQHFRENRLCTTSVLDMLEKCEKHWSCAQPRYDEMERHG
jgi:hypothetical protein